MLANDREGFALPSLPASQTRNAQASANAQSTLLVPNTQPGAQNTQPAGRLIRPKKVLRTPPTSDQAPAVSMQTTSTSVNPAPTTNKTPFQIALSTRNPFSKMMSSQNAQSSQPSATSSKSRRWTPQEDEAIIRGKRAKLTAPAIIKQYKLDRNDSAVRNRLRELVSISCCPFPNIRSLVCLANPPSQTTKTKVTITSLIANRCIGNQGTEGPAAA